MAEKEYIEREVACEHIRNGARTSMQKLFAECCVRSTPLADVVPMAEYDKLKRQFDQLDAECDRLENIESRLYDEIIKVKKIFAEIDKITLKYLSDKEYSTGEMVYDIAELKEKYEEGE